MQSRREKYVTEPLYLQLLSPTDLADEFCVAYSARRNEPGAFPSALSASRSRYASPPARPGTRQGPGGPH